MQTLKHITTGLLLLVSIGITAQQGINYKALVKDGGGNVIANDLIAVQFIIYKGVALTNNVYQETHTPTTDANGIVILIIGEGTTGDTFSAIDWGSDDHYLNVQINTGSGLIDMGTTQFMAVPYALSAANISGLEATDEGNGIGWRLIGKDLTNYGSIGLNAVDLSHSNEVDDGALGEASFATGLNTKASGESSTAMGRNSFATGYGSTAIGNSTATGYGSAAVGWNVTASGDYSIALGAYSDATGSYSTAIGRSNIGGGDPNSWVDTDPLFEIGNGDFISSNNALTVLKNGSISAPSFTNTLIDIAGNSALITKEYADTNYQLTSTSVTEINDLTDGKSDDDGSSLFLGVDAGLNDDGTNNENVGLGFEVLKNNTSGNGNAATGYQALYNNTSGSGNDAFGRRALFANTIGTDNTAVGFLALEDNSIGNSNTAIGSNSLNKNTASFNSAVGYNALSFNTTGDANTAIGSNALYLNTTGYSNTATGVQALFANTTGINNTATGVQALRSNTTGDENTANGYRALYSNTTGNGNTVNGYQTLYSNTTGSLNTAIGTEALFNTITGVNNAVLGYRALYNNVDGGNNVALGVRALQQNISGNLNTAVGYRALYNSIVDKNTAMGYEALFNNSSGIFNTAHGAQALWGNTTGNYNTAAGYQSLFANITGVNNTATGYRALEQNSTGNDNTAKGYQTLFNNTTGSGNTATGFDALLSNILGDNNTAVGYQADVGSDNLTNATAIGANAVVSQSNSLVLGNNVKVGIGISAPIYNLHVGDGNINATNGSNTRMVVSDNDNNQRAAVLGLAKTNAGVKVEAQLEANGSTNSGPSVIVGSASSHPLYIRTGNLTRMTVTTSGDVGIGTSAPGEKLHVVGNICYTGSIGACSDIRYKKNLIPVSQILPKLKSIGVYTYEWDTVHFPEKGFTKERQLGVIAQELELNFPELVQTDGEGYKTVDYAKMSAALLQGLKEQQEIIEEQNNKLNSQESKIETQDKNYVKLLKRVEQLELAGNQ